ncbi:hypothetical protein DES45_10687 [Microvirga subterranea]|uniref:Uncharacterized protein n=1 Tax=Microvirga subterranea TaxID=186651 RepID=A0A370HIK1_9HYPH|nr:hypothetical protein DES45_10687 [Microvirga subterranea]
MVHARRGPGPKPHLFPDRRMRRKRHRRRAARLRSGTSTMSWLLFERWSLPGVSQRLMRYPEGRPALLGWSAVSLHGSDRRQARTPSFDRDDASRRRRDRSRRCPSRWGLHRSLDDDRSDCVFRQADQPCGDLHLAVDVVGQSSGSRHGLLDVGWVVPRASPAPLGRRCMVLDHPNSSTLLQTNAARQKLCSAPLSQDQATCCYMNASRAVDRIIFPEWAGAKAAAPS